MILKTTSSRALLTLGILSASFAYYVSKWRTLHDDLSKRVTHRSETGTNDILARLKSNLESLPDDSLHDETKYLVLYDEATKTVATSALPQWDEQRLLTTYLRFNMCKFSSLPQAWILWLLAAQSDKKTFQKELISSLDFTKGDRVCGGYVVENRSPNMAEMSMSMGQPGSKEHIQGRLAISLHVHESTGTTIFRTQTVMYRQQDSATLMPLERALPKWFHELASWWLIEQGTNHLMQLKWMDRS